MVNSSIISYTFLSVFPLLHLHFVRQKSSPMSFVSPRRALSQAAEVKARDELFGKFDGIVERSMKGDLFLGVSGGSIGAT